MTVAPHRLSGVAALRVAQTQTLHKMRGEKDTEFVKRIVAAYLNVSEELAQKGDLTLLKQIIFDGT